MKIIDSKIIDSGFEKFNGQKILKLNLGYAAMRTLCTNTRREYVIDCSLNKKADRGTVLALALALKEYIQKKFPEYERIGIALPSCLPGIAVNLAVQLAGKVSVNLNFTMGAEAERSCLERANVKMVIGSKKVRDKVDSHSPDYPWTDNFFDIGDILKEIGKKRIAAKLVAVRLLPFWVLSRIYGIPRDGGDREASIIFTSGSEGMPKAAVLTHRNIMANCVQMWNIGLINSDTRLHSNLPLFHSFGQTIQVWMTAIYGMQSVTVQSPLEVQANLEASRKYKSTIMISTPTFLRSYYKKGKPEDFPAMHGVIGGAEKTPEGFIEKWNEKFPNVYYWEGYGLTEASPVVAVNLPPNLKRGEFCPQPSQTMAESVGEIFPGMLAAVANPDKKVICYTGDGSIMMNLQELQTIKTHNLPIRIFIIRNDGYSSIKQTHKNFFNARYIGCNAASGVETPDFREVAKAFGIESERIETGDGLAGRLKAALERRGPFVCEIVCQDDYMFSPKLSAKQMPDGSIISPSLEDMFPFLDREEFESNMLK